MVNVAIIEIYSQTAQTSQLFVSGNNLITQMTQVGPQGPVGPSPTIADPGDFTLLFNNKLI